MGKLGIRGPPSDFTVRLYRPTLFGMTKRSFTAALLPGPCTDMTQPWQHWQLPPETHLTRKHLANASLRTGFRHSIPSSRTSRVKIPSRRCPPEFALFAARLSRSPTADPSGAQMGQRGISAYSAETSSNHACHAPVSSPPSPPSPPGRAGTNDGSTYTAKSSDT